MKGVMLMLAIATVAVFRTALAYEGNTTNTNMTVPRTCMPGYELVNSTCQACVPGMFNAHRGGRCLGCVDGFFSNASNSTSCVHCGPNERSTLPRNHEETCHCKVGFGGATLSIYDDRSYCVRCAVGFFSAGALPDDGSVAQREICEQCPAGTSTNDTQSTHASNCAKIYANVAVSTAHSTTFEIPASTSPSTQASDLDYTITPGYGPVASTHLPPAETLPYVIYTTSASVN